MNRPSLFGPLVWWELLRLARRGHVARSRVLLLYALLLAVAGFVFVKSYPGSPAPLFLGTADPVPVEKAAASARQLVLLLLEVQLLLVAVFTPAYAAAAVAEEKDRHTLPSLLATELSDREIVWGKAVARTVFVLAAVASGIPVLALTLLLGGVNADFLAAGYALTAGTAFLCAAVGVSAACYSPDTRTAVVRAYVQTAALLSLIPPFVLLSPFAMLVYYEMEIEAGVWQAAVGFGYPLGQTVIAWVLLIEATRGLRRPGPTAGPPTPTAYPEPPRGRPVPVVFGPSDPEPAPLPPVGDADPVLWKERHAGRTPPVPVLDRPLRLFVAVGAVAAVALLAGGGWQLAKLALRALDPDEAERFLDREVTGDASMMLKSAGVLSAVLYLLPLAAGVTGCVAGERFRGTLDSLLATPLGRRRILWSKVRAHAERGLVFAGVAAAALGAGYGIDGGTRAGLRAVATFAAGVGLVVGFGAWLSVRCAAPVRAFRLSLPAVAAAVVLPVLAPGAVNWAAAFALAGGVLWWRAGTELERGA